MNGRVRTQRQAQDLASSVACLPPWGTFRDRSWRRALAAFVLFWVINSSEARAQNPSVELVPSIGYLRLFGGEGIQFQFDINRRIGAGPALAHWVGGFAQLSNTDLASATRPSIANRRTYVLGAAYSLRFRPGQRTSFGLAIPVAHAWSNNTPDVAIADPSGRPPEDRTGAEGTGIRIGLEGFLRHRLSPFLDLIATGGIGHNPIYENQESRSLSYLRLGLGMRP